jgi:hypothetical protein
LQAFPFLLPAAALCVTALMTRDLKIRVQVDRKFMEGPTSTAQIAIPSLYPEIPQSHFLILYSPAIELYSFSGVEACIVTRG